MKMAYHENGGNESFEIKDNVMLTLKAESEPLQQHNFIVEDLGNVHSIVRRLIPLECERLMGLPDKYTECMGADSHRYKGCGNGWLTPQPRWICRRIEAYDILHGFDTTHTYGTVCSGIECMSVAVSGMNWKPVFFSEIEKAPCRLLATHYPTVPNLGDMTKIHYDNEKGVITNGTDDVVFRGELSVLAGGTPCQDVSTCGRRLGMSEGSGTRSSLAFSYVRIAKELRPRWLLWENVPGVLSSNGGRDFLEFLRQINELGYHVAWRIMDGQYTRVDKFPFAIPQRRRRVWVVGYLGADDTAPCQVLFEQASVRGDTPPVRKTRKRIAADSEACTSVHDKQVGLPVSLGAGEVAPTLISSDYKGPGNTQGGKLIVDTMCFDQVPRTRIPNMTYEVAPNLPAQMGTGGNNQPCIFGKVSRPRGKDGEGERWDSIDVASTMNAFDIGDTRAQELVTQTVTNSNGDDVMPTISASEYKMTQHQKDTRGGYVIAEFRDVR